MLFLNNTAVATDNSIDNNVTRCMLSQNTDTADRNISYQCIKHDNNDNHDMKIGFLMYAILKTS